MPREFPLESPDAFRVLLEAMKNGTQAVYNSLLDNVNHLRGRLRLTFYPSYSSFLCDRHISIVQTTEVAHLDIGCLHKSRVKMNPNRNRYVISYIASSELTNTVQGQPMIMQAMDSRTKHFAQS